MPLFHTFVARRREVVGVLAGHFPSLLSLTFVLALLGRDPFQLLRDPRQPTTKVLLRPTGEFIILIRFLFFGPSQLLLAGLLLFLLGSILEDACAGMEASRHVTLLA